MTWCLMVVSLGLVGLAGVVLTAQPPRLRELNPVRLLRGCLALLLLTVALGLILIAKFIGF